MDVKVNISSLRTSAAGKVREEIASSTNLRNQVQKMTSQDAAISSLRIVSIKSLKADVSSVATPADAKRLSKDIASELRSPFASEDEKERQIEAAAGYLDPDKASRLLEE